MSQFKLTSKYKPTGDQPKAIAQLVEGLKKGEKEQTLLGVTGSGKSVIGSTKVFIEQGGKAYHLPIEQLGGVFAEELVQDPEATQYVELGVDARTISFSPNTSTVESSVVDEISRHRYNKQLYRVETSCGRINTFTDDHNVYVLRDGAMCLVPSAELRVGDYLPVPDKLPEPAKAMSHIDCREWLPEDNFYVSVNDLQDEVKEYLPREKRWRVENQQERIKLAEYQRTPQPLAVAMQERVGSKHKTATIPLIIPASKELWRFMGLFIAEGHATPSYIVLSTGDESIADELKSGAACFGLRLAKRLKTYDYQISSKVLSQLLITLCGSNAHVKHLPVFWPQCSNSQLAALLGGIFAGDGWVEPNCIGLMSVSEELIYDVQTALLRFGIHARVRIKMVRYKGGFTKNWLLSIYGQSDLRAFQSQIGFGLARKDQVLQDNLSGLVIPNTNVDLMPLPFLRLESLRRFYNLEQRDSADVLGCSRSLISFYLSGKRLPSRKRAKVLIDYFMQKDQQLGEGKNMSWLGSLQAATDLFWSPISSISNSPGNGRVVYDLAVPGNQTFFAGQGGYFVHNTFTMANVIQQTQKPTLILSHNKTLAAQLYGEFRNFFPNNAVHYFVSYFDYYQPEAYIPRSDTYIEKDSQINEEIDRLRHAATDALLSRKDVIIVASVSCIYGIGSVEDYNGLSVVVVKGERRVRDKLLRQLTDIQYQRNDIDFHRGTFRVRGDVVDVFPAGEELAYRIDFDGDEIERIIKIDPLTGEILAHLNELKIFPSSHYVTPFEKLKGAMVNIQDELDARLKFFKKQGMLVEAQRLAQRTKFDLEMLEETGFVKGIENYSRYLTDREEGEQPATLLDYFPDDFLMFVDESHMTMPQIRGMYNGDRARKEVLVEHGFRLPSALDNRPLTFNEFEHHINKITYVSATPADYELSRSPKPAQQVIRPTGLLDPPITVRPVDGQIDDLIAEIRDTVKKGQRVLVTTLTKRMSEDLTDYLKEINIKVTYLHSDIDTLERTDILRDLRLGTYDVVVGINLLREGLDLPEVSLVAILDADKEGFLRSEQALIQTIGRAARHIEGRVIMYADHVTGSMQRALDETDRRRKIQAAYNKEHHITPEGIAKAIEKGMRPDLPEETNKLNLKKIPKDEYAGIIRELTAQMELASANLQFEKAAELRDTIADIKSKM